MARPPGGDHRVKLPWSRRREDRAAYTDAIVSALLANVQGSGGSAADVAAVELAAGLWARAFASARVEPDGPAAQALTPEVLATAARTLILRGESVFSIELVGGMPALVPAWSWDIQGGPHPTTWRYAMELAGPTAPEQRNRPSAGVVHLRYSADPDRPWQGIGPLARAGASAALLGRLEQRLSEEANARVGQLLPVPKDGQDESITRLKADLKSLAGNVALVETTAAGWGQGTQARPSREWHLERMGANPPPVLESLRSGAGLDILAACGVPPSLGSANVDGTAQRESWRRFLHGSVAPLGDLILGELREKLDLPELRFSFGKLFASDLTGRARSLGIMIKAGMELETALILSGLDDAT